MTLHHKFILISCFLVLQACKKQESVIIESGIILSQDSMSTHVEKQFSKWNSLVCQDDLRYMDTLKTFYEKRNYKPLWWDAITGYSASWSNLQLFLAHSESHGMDY